MKKDLKTRLVKVLREDTINFNRYMRFCRHYNSAFRTNLRDANLRGADLRGADLLGVDLCRADLSDADLRNADLRGVDLRNADLRGVDLRGANLDFASMPLWCGDLYANYDNKQIIQQLYHVLSHIKNSTNVSEEMKELLNETNLKWANKFHRVDECGKIENKIQ